ncbi:MAG TPA: helix-turn-helix transcriptional regulator, partial [Phototrophicaceae bacterium]|nr:helix-turn-helix transcriptional regulator [Phototrophicaceae bacterium]
MNLKGSLPLLILHVLAQGSNHGYGIAKLIRDQSGGVLDFKEGTLYPTLHTLEKQGLIESDEREEGGRMRCRYHLTPFGQAALAAQRQEWARYVEAVNRVLTNEKS